MPEEPIEVARDEWGVILYNEAWRTLELRWLPATRDGGDADLRNTMVVFAEEGERRKPTLMVVDTTQFLHKWADGMMEWRNETIIPRYNAAEVSKFAFIAGADFPGQTVETGAEPAPDGPANFPTGWFKSREAAYAWLAR